MSKKLLLSGRPCDEGLYPEENKSSNDFTRNSYVSNITDPICRIFLFFRNGSNFLASLLPLEGVLLNVNC